MRGDCIDIPLVRGVCVVIPLVRGDCEGCVGIPLSEEAIVGVVALRSLLCEVDSCLAKCPSL